VPFLPEHARTPWLANSGIDHSQPEIRVKGPSGPMELLGSRNVMAHQVAGLTALDSDALEIAGVASGRYLIELPAMPGCLVAGPSEVELGPESELAVPLTVEYVGSVHGY
jgi:hypothetical protein